MSAALLVTRFTIASGEPGDIFTVSAPVASNKSPTATPINDGDASVSTMTGALSYAYPVELPPARMKPSLSLAYSSQAAIYGTLAAGWSLSGVGIIMEDTSGGRLVGGAKKYASSLAGGAQLIQVKEPAVGVAYRAQHDSSFTRYERMPAGSFWWRAYASDGTTYYFGHKDAHTSGCSIVSDGYAPLTRMEDAFGNAIDFTYESVVDGECRLRAITWGQNANAGIGYFGALELNYSSTNYTCAAGPIGAQTSYRTGTKIVTGASQLDSIRIAAFAPQSTSSVTGGPIPANPEHTRTITLKYSTDPAQQVSQASNCAARHAPYRELLSIQETAVGINAPAVALPATELKYGDASVTYSAAQGVVQLPWYDPAPFNLGWGLRFDRGNEWPTVEAMMIDVDGDGRVDRLVNLNDGVQLQLNEQFTSARVGADGYPLRVDLRDSSSPYYLYQGVRGDSRRGLDIDADGRVDVVRFADDGSKRPVIQFNHGGQFGTPINDVGDAIGGLSRYLLVNDQLPQVNNYTWEIRSDLIDFDGDGVIEAVDFGTSYTPSIPDIRISKQAVAHPPRLLYEIKNNRGATTTVTYSTLHGAAVTNTARRSPPAEQRVVQSVTTHDDFSATDMTVSYHYKDPVFSPSLEGTRTWGLRGFDTVETTGPTGAKTIERYDFTIDYTGRIKSKLVMPAPSEMTVTDEVRSIDETTWEQRTLFRGELKTVHATSIDRWTCNNGQTEAACRSNRDTHTRTVTTLTALASTTGPDYSTLLMWQPTSTRLQTGLAAADGDRITTTTYAVAADAYRYRARPLTTTREVQQQGALVTYAKSEQIWDSSYRVPNFDMTWISDDNERRIVTTRNYDMSTGNVINVQNPRGNMTTFAYDARKLFVARTDAPGTQDDYEYEYDYGTGAKTIVRGPQVAWCAVYTTLSCSGEGLTRSEERFRYDGLGRLLERFISVNRDLSLYEYTLKKVEDTEYVDGIVDGAPPSIKKWSAIDDDGTNVRYAIQKTELDGLGRTIRQTSYALGAAADDAVTTYKYDNDGSLQYVEAPDPSATDKRHVVYAYTSDSLGRPTGIRRPDAPLGQESGVDLSYNGLTRTSREVAGASGGKPAATITMSDVFGRTTEVLEQLHADGQSPGSGARQSSAVWSRTTYTYGPDDNVTQIVDPDGITTTLVHDRAGRRTEITRGTRTWQYGYDANSNVESITEPCGAAMCGLDVTTTIAYDENDRPTSKVLAPRNLTSDDIDLLGASYETFEYGFTPNGAGRLARWRSHGSTSSTPVLDQQFIYTPQGQRTNNIQTFNAAGYTNLQRDSIHRYFWSGRLAETSYRDFVNGDQFTRANYEYDARGLPSEVWISTTGGSTWTHPPTIETRNIAGLVVNRRTQDLTGSMPSIESRWAYDKLGRVTSQVIEKGPSSTPVARQDVTYFGNDDPATLIHDIGKTHRAFAFTYDQRHQLLTAKETTTSGALFDAQYSYGCPASTNCTKRGGRFQYAKEASSGGVGGNVIPRDVQYQYAGSDPEQVTALVDVSTGLPLYTYEYDDSGYQTLRCRGAITNGSCNGDSLSFLYDGKGQLRRVTKRNASGTLTGSEEFWYDSDGTRTIVLTRDAAGAKTKLVWTVEQTETHFDANGEVTKAYSHVSLGTPLARVERTSNTSATIEFQFHGLANNTIAAVDAQTGALNAAFTYAPFGEVIEAVNGDEHRRRMNDKQVDALSDLAYYGARYYDRTAISWTQADPLFRFVPDLAKRDNPRRANLYQFTLNNPLRYMDPDGRNPANTSDYRSEAEVRASYAAALEGDSNWMVSGADHFSSTGGRYVQVKRNDGRMHECGAQGCFDNEGVDDELTEMWIPDDLPRMAGQYGTLARTGAVVDKRFKGSMQAAAARAAGAAIGVTLVFGGVYVASLFTAEAGTAGGLRLAEAIEARTAGAAGKLPFPGFQEWGRPLWGTGAAGAMEAMRNMSAQLAASLDPAKVRAAAEFYRQAVSNGRGGNTAPLRVQLMELIQQLQR